MKSLCFSCGKEIDAEEAYNVINSIYLCSECCWKMLYKGRVEFPPETQKLMRYIERYVQLR